MQQIHYAGLLTEDWHFIHWSITACCIFNNMTALTPDATRRPILRVMRQSIKRLILSLSHHHACSVLLPASLRYFICDCGNDWDSVYYRSGLNVQVSETMGKHTTTRNIGDTPLSIRHTVQPRSHTQACNVIAMLRSTQTSIASAGKSPELMLNTNQSGKTAPRYYKSSGAGTHDL